MDESKKKAGKNVRTGTTLAPCGCVSPFQDKTYSKGLRVHNLGGKTTCTVCGLTKA